MNAVIVEKLRDIAEETRLARVQGVAPERAVVHVEGRQYEGLVCAVEDRTVVLHVTGPWPTRVIPLEEIVAVGNVAA